VYARVTYIEHLSDIRNNAFENLQIYLQR